MKETSPRTDTTTHRVPLSLCPERLGVLSALALSVVSLGGLLVLLGGVAAMVIQTRDIEAHTDLAAVRTEHRKLEQELASLNQRLGGVWDLHLEARAVVGFAPEVTGAGASTWDSAIDTPVELETPFDQAWDSSVTQLDETIRQARQVSECYAHLLTRMERNAAVWAGIPSIQPVFRADVSSRFGLRTDPFTGRLGWHQGLDFSAPVGTPVRAAGAGLVVRAGWYGNYGQLVEIDHGNGLVTRYAHMSRLEVKLGDRVGREDLLGMVGSTGRSNAPHLHYEVHLAGQPVNPEPYILTDFALAAGGSTGSGGAPVPAAPHRD